LRALTTTHIGGRRPGPLRPGRGRSRARHRRQAVMHNWPQAKPRSVTPKRATPKPW